MDCIRNLRNLFECDIRGEFNQIDVDLIYEPLYSSIHDIHFFRQELEEEYE